MKKYLILAVLVMVVMLVGCKIKAKFKDSESPPKERIEANQEYRSIGDFNFVIETCPFKDLRIYHLKFNKLPEGTINEILEIPGTINDDVATMGVKFKGREYKLRVVKGTAFRWDEIEPEVVEILLRAHIRQTVIIDLDKWTFKNSDIEPKIIWNAEWLWFEWDQYLAINDKAIEMGFRDDGIMVWRYVEPKLSGTIPSGVTESDISSFGYGGHVSRM
jgi:hypothetical protein